MRDKKFRGFFKRAGKVAIPIVCFFVGILLYTTSIQEFVEDPLNMRSWQNIARGENDPGGGAGSGVLRYYVVHHGHFTYTANITVNATVYAVDKDNNTHANSTVPYGTALDIVFKVRFNTTHAYNSSGGGSWELDWVRGNLTAPYHSLTLQGMDEYHIVNNSNFMWVHYVWDGTLGGGGAGVTIARGANSTQNLISIFAYF